MWATTSTQTPFFSFPKLPPPPPPTTIQLQRRARHVATTAMSSSEEITGLGQAVLSAIKSSPSNKKVQQKHQGKPNNNNNKKKEDNTSASEISGSDILRALQKANIKKQQQKKNKGSGSGDLKSNSVNNEKKKVVDYDKIRPVSIKSDWGTRLNDLEKRLQEFLPH